MAQDRRKNTKNTGSRNVSLAQKAGVAAEQPQKTTKKRKKRRVSPGKIIVIVLLVILIVVLGIFLYMVGKTVYESLTVKEEGPSVNLTNYDTTPLSDIDKVSYFIVGLMGEEEDDTTEMLALVCYDKAAKKLNFMQIPQDTYLGETDNWTVKKIGDVWANPKPLDWCEYDRKQVFAPEISDGKHVTCNTPITQKEGSAVENLVKVFNDQYSMPIDNYFLLPQKAFVKLVNLVNGVDVELESDMKLADIQYTQGVQTLDGDSALEYISKRDGSGADGDIARLVRQRKVYVALFQRLLATPQQKLIDDVIGPLQNGSTPIRTSSREDGLRSMLIAPSDEKMESMTFIKAFCEMLTDMASINTSDMTLYMMPGEAATLNSVGYFSVHKAELLTLLTDAFNPYGRAISESDLQVTEIASEKQSNLYKQTFAELAVTQSGVTAPESPDPSSAASSES